jgi:hypothetical protein
MQEIDSIETAKLIQGLSGGSTGSLAMAFGDIRVAQRADWMVEQIAALGTLVLRQIGGTRAGEMAAHGFLSSPHVSVDRIVSTAAVRTARQCAGFHVLVVQDTTEINFKGRAQKRRGFGPAGDGETPGFFIHPAIAVDIKTEAVIGLVDMKIWTRSEDPTPPRRNLPFEDKESARWLWGCQSAAALLNEATSVTMAADRESDIFPLFARRPERIDLIVRAAHNRNLNDGGALFEALGKTQSLGTTIVKVAPRGPGDKGRIAKVELAAGKVRIASPRNNRVDDLPEFIELTLVEAREVNAPKGSTPLLWRLYTTYTVTSLGQANQVVQLYRLRWRIEQTFRSLKSDGLALEDSQVIDRQRMFNLAAIALIAAIRIIQLVDARDGSPRPASDVIDDAFADALKRISKKLEGNTERQKNPHDPGSLAFVSWIAARLGGWNCYYKPPGPKTMRTGWNRLAAMLEGYLVATQG